MSEPLVGIILVNYNNAPDTLECIYSLQKITYTNAHIIVVDNGSSDDSAKILKENQENANFDLICLKDNNGFSAGNNVGIRYALKKQAKYVLLLNNDTLVDSDFLTELITYQEEHEDCDAAICKIYYAYEPKHIWYAGGSISNVTGRTTHDNYGAPDTFFSLESPREVSFATGCCLCLKADIINSVGFLDEDYFLYDEDTDYCLRMTKHKKHIYYIPSAVIYHKVSASTGSVSELTQYYTARNHFILISKNYKGIKKITAVIYTYLMLLKRCINKEINFSHTLNGIRAYYHGEKGKRR